MAFLIKCYLLLAECLGEKYSLDLKTNRKQLDFQAKIIKNNREYHVTKTFGSKVTVKDPLSDVSLEIAEGVQAVAMQSINFKFELLERVIQNECLVSPVMQFHIKEQSQQRKREGQKYTAMIPHCLSRYHNLSCIKVRFGSLRKPLSMLEVQKGNPKNENLPYFEINNRHITVFANHFCDVVCSSTQKVRTSKILVIPFGWISTPDSESQTDMKMKVYMCSYLYSKRDIRKVSYFTFIFKAQYFWFFLMMVTLIFTACTALSTKLSPSTLICTIY